MINKFSLALFALRLAAAQLFALDAAQLENMVTIQEMAQNQAKITLSNTSTLNFTVQFDTLNQFDRINPVQRIFDRIKPLLKTYVAPGAHLDIDFTKINTTDFLRIYITFKPDNQDNLSYMKCDVWTGKFLGRWKKECSEIESIFVK